jgi:hypothetical protein
MTISLPEFLKIASQEQIDILTQLDNLSTIEHNLVLSINGLLEQVGDGVVHIPGTDSITICESEDDAVIITLKERIKLKEVRYEIANILLKAKTDLSMGDVGIIERQYENYKRYLDE